jgi:ABC-type multidrug transport system fused ATPase/permease subunit
MDKGKITEMGTHDELVAKKNGIYSGLYDIQSGGYLVE